MIQRQAERHGSNAQQAVRLLLDLVARVTPMDELARVQAINDFVNYRVYSGEDEVIWGQVDYWATPLEMFARNQGDCEDFAIAKYFSLRMAGVDPARLRLVYVQARQRGAPDSKPQAHMVLAYYPAGAAGGEPLILDNLQLELRPGSRRPDLQPVFSFNVEGLWSGTQGTTSGGDPTARLSRWRDLIVRARAEGFL